MTREHWMRGMLMQADNFQHVDSGSERDANMRKALAGVLLAAKDGPWSRLASEVKSMTEGCEISVPEACENFPEVKRCGAWPECECVFK